MLKSFTGEIAVSRQSKARWEEGAVDLGHCPVCTVDGEVLQRSLNQQSFTISAGQSIESVFLVLAELGLTL
jgi:hypothetical protein